MSTEQARDAQRTMWTVGNYPAVAEASRKITLSQRSVLDDKSEAFADCTPTTSC